VRSIHQHGKLLPAWLPSLLLTLDLPLVCPKANTIVCGSRKYRSSVCQIWGGLLARTSRYYNKALKLWPDWRQEGTSIHRGFSPCTGDCTSAHAQCIGQVNLQKLNWFFNTDPSPGYQFFTPRASKINSHSEEELGNCTLRDWPPMLDIDVVYTNRERSREELGEERGASIWRATQASFSNERRIWKGVIWELWSVVATER